VCDCPECAEKLAKAHEHLLEQAETVNATAKELARVRRDLTNLQGTGVTAMEVAKVLAVWAEGRPEKRLNLSPHGARARQVRLALQLGHTNPPLPCEIHAPDGRKKPHPPKNAICTATDELIEAVRGLKLVPWVGPRGRCPAGTKGAQPFDGIEYAFTVKEAMRNGNGSVRMVSESQIEKMRGIYRRSLVAPSERWFKLYESVSAAAEDLLRCAVDAWHDEAPENTGEIVDLASHRRGAA